MVYQQKLVAVIKCNGKILREVGDNTVLLPFLAEYEIFIKNLESRDCVLNISIDGEDVLDGQSIIIKANSSCSLEGFLKGNRTTNKFKFIQKTDKIINHRGDRVDDGLIRIEYRFTKIHQTITTTHRVNWQHPVWCTCLICRPIQIQPYIYPVSPNPAWPWPTTPYVTYGGAVSNSTFTVSNSIGGPGTLGSAGSPDATQVNYCASNTMLSGEAKGEASVGQLSNSINSNAFIPQDDEGITVKGSKSNQQFGQAYVSPLEEQSFVIVLRLRGTNKVDQPVEKPVLVSNKVKCSTCGRNNKSHIKYCPECGTALF